jgi:transposase-like protein
VVFFDALRVKIRDEGMVKNKAVYVALALNPDGEKEVLGLWIDRPITVFATGARATGNVQCPT